MWQCQRMLTALLLLCAVAVGQDGALLIDDFESGGLERWWVSGSGEYYKGGGGRKGLGIVPDPERGSKVLRAHIAFTDASSSEKCFISRNFASPDPLLAYDRVSFWYKLTTDKLDPEATFRCRLRVSSNQFVDVRVVEPSDVRVGQWVHADLRIVSAKVRNVYGTLFMPVKQVTFRVDDQDDANVEFDLFVDDFRLHRKPQPDTRYEPKVSRLSKGPKPRVLVVTQSTAGYYNIQEAIESMPEGTHVEVALFRGLHLPLSRFAKTRDALFAFDVVAMIDVDPYVMTREQLEWLMDYVASGGGLLFAAGPNTLGKSIDFKEGLAKMLPVTVAPGQSPQTIGKPARTLAAHDVVAGVPEALGMLRWAFPLDLKPDARTLAGARAHVPTGWGVYTGGGPGDGALGVGPGHDSPHSATLTTKSFYVNPKTGKPSFISVSLVAGDSSGYGGERACPCKPATTYRLSFWIKGELPTVKVVALAWKTDEAKPADRQNIDTSIGQIKVTPKWTRHEGTFKTEADSKRLVVRFHFSHSPKGFELGKGISVDDVQIVEADTGKPLGWKHGDAEAVFSAPMLVAGQFQRGRVLVFDAMPTGADRTARDSVFRGPFFDDLIRDAIRWLGRRAAAARFSRVSLSADEIDRGDAATLGATVSAVEPVTVVCKVDNTVQTQHTLAAGSTQAVAVRFAPGAKMAAGEHTLCIQARSGDGRVLARRDAAVLLHDPVAATLSFRPCNAVHAGQALRFTVSAAFRHTAAKFTGEAKVSAQFIDPSGQPASTIAPVAARVEAGKMAPVDMQAALPDLATGKYALEAVVACDAGRSTTREDVFVVDPLERENFYPILGVGGIGAREQEMDPRRQRERVDELWEHGLNTLSTRYPEAMSYAARRGMALFRDYTRYTLCEHRTGHSRPCVFAPEHEAAMAKRLKRNVEWGNSVPRMTSMKILDEPHARPAEFVECEHCRQAFAKRFGYPMPAKKALPELPLPKRIQLSRFVADYVAKSYSDAKRISLAQGRRFDLILTCDIGGFGGAGFKSMQDVYLWAQPADCVDYDYYIYFYSTSDRVRYESGHYCYAFIREVAQCQGKPWGHYTEIDDRNYPFQINPVEASSEHTYTAIAHGADYINTFITRAFATGSGARDERWADFGREACKVRSVGALLNKLERPRSELALYFPHADYLSRGKKPHRPRYAYELLLRAFGEADVAHELGVLDKGFGDRKAIVLTDTDVLPDKAAQLLNDFVRAGGLLICDHAPTYNDKGQPCKLDPALFAGKAEAKLGEVTTVRTTSYGRGRCLLLAHDLHKLYYDAVETPDPAAEKSLREFVWRALSDAKVKPFARAEDPEFEVGVLAGEDTWLLVVVNHAGDERTTRVTLGKLPFEPKYVVELPAYTPVSLAADRRSLDVTLPSRYSTMVAFYRAKPAAVSVSAANASRGKPLTYRVDLLGAGREPCAGRHLVDVAVKDPTGSLRTRFGGRWTTTKGRLTRSVLVPVNARRGAWRIECRVLGTDLAARTSIQVD